MEILENQITALMIFYWKITTERHRLSKISRLRRGLVFSSVDSIYRDTQSISINCNFVIGKSQKETQNLEKLVPAARHNFVFA